MNLASIVSNYGVKHMFRNKTLYRRTETAATDCIIVMSFVAVADSMSGCEYLNPQEIPQQIVTV